MQKKPFPLWALWLAIFGEIGAIVAMLYMIWHNIKCAFGMH